LEKINRQASISDKLNNQQMAKWFDKSAYVLNLICEERKLLKQLIEKLNSVKVKLLTISEIRTMGKPLLDFYTDATIGSARMREPDEINMIFGIPIGEPNPTSEGGLNGGTHGKDGMKRHAKVGVVGLPDPRSVVDLPTQMNTLEGYTNVSDNVQYKFWETRDGKSLEK